MKDLIKENLNSVFNYFAPKNKYIGILSIPHSGEFIPSEFKSYLTDDDKAIGADVDYKVDHLVDIDQLTENGIAVIVSNIHRTCVDLNRAEQICVLNWEKNSHGVELVVNRPSKEQTKFLIQKYYRPYYEMLKTMINELHKYQKNEVSFIDLHSMPSKPTNYHLEINPNQKMVRPDFCVSDIEGISCSTDYINFICDNLKSFSPNVTQNDPYFGGHITRHVNATFKRINNIQIEINRGIYMDEEKKELNYKLVKKLKPRLTAALIKQYKEYMS